MGDLPNLFTVYSYPHLLPDDHLLVETPEANLSRVIQWIKVRLCRLFQYQATATRPPVGEKKGVLVRVGSSNRKADARLIRELHRAARHQSYDEEPLLEGNSEALDFRVISELLAGIRKLTTRDLLTLRLMTTHQRRKVPTIGGMLLFGKERLKYFSDAWIHCGRFAGTTKQKFIDVVELNDYPIYAIDQALDDTNRAIIDLLGQANGLSVKDIAATIGLSTRAIRSRIGKLVEKGLATVVGTGPRDPKRKFFLAGKSVTKYS